MKEVVKVVEMLEEATQGSEGGGKAERRQRRHCGATSGGGVWQAAMEAGRTVILVAQDNGHKKLGVQMVLALPRQKPEQKMPLLKKRGGYISRTPGLYI